MSSPRRCRHHAAAAQPVQLRETSADFRKQIALRVWTVGRRVLGRGDRCIGASNLSRRQAAVGGKLQLSVAFQSAQSFPGDILSGRARVVY